MIWMLSGVIIMSSTIIFGNPKTDEHYQVKMRLGNIPTDFSGEWEENTIYKDGINRAISEDIYRLKIFQNNEEIKGEYCFSVDNARLMDCEIGNSLIKGRVDNDVARVELSGSRHTRPIGATLAREGKWLILTADETNEVLPPQIRLRQRIIDVGSGSPNN